MTGETLTAAWEQMRETLVERRDAYAAEGYEVTTGTADYGAVVVEDGTGQLRFTVADNVAADLAAAAEGTTFPVTRVSYVDVDGYRLFLLAALDPDAETALLLAGGVERDRVATLRDASALETVLRRADGSIAVALEHDGVDPFVDGIDG